MSSSPKIYPKGTREKRIDGGETTNDNGIMFAVWNDEKHSLKIPDIDAQHKEFFLLTNQIAEENSHPGDHRPLEGTLKRFYAYCHYHFSSEETLFKNYHYPQMTEHMHQHEEFTSQIHRYLERSRENAVFPFDQLQDELVGWILVHIQEEDKKYARFFRDQGIVPTTGLSLADHPNNDVLKLWEEKKLALEIKEIDHQHKELVAILQQTNDLLNTSDQRQKLFLPTILKKLFYYSEYHFSFEEELLSRHRYDLIEDHKKLHAGYVRRILVFSEEYKKGESRLTEEIMLFLKDWIVNHILKEDRDFKDRMHSPSSQ